MEKIEKELVPSDRSRYIVLIIYDITNNKRRLEMVYCLEQYAIRVQKSAFEGFLTRKQYEQVSKESSAIIDSEEDSLRIYLLMDHAQVTSWGRGEIKENEIIIY